MRLGYNTNGLSHHRLADAIDLLADEGYESVAITLDVGALDPYDDRATLERQLKRTRQQLDRRGLACVVETGARYLLNPRKKHDPTLLDPSPDRRAIRIDFLCRAIDIAAILGAEAVSIWSGILPDGTTPLEGMERLTSSLRTLLQYAEGSDMWVAFEPEPGMFIDTLERFSQLDDRLGPHPLFDLTMDIGHVHCVESGPIADHIRRWGARIVNVHIEDMNRGVHEHLMFGRGTIDFPPVIQALQEVGYAGGLHVEMSRHSHMAVEAVRDSATFLRRLLARR